jgi:hypothetical protein
MTEYIHESRYIVLWYTCSKYRSGTFFLSRYLNMNRISNESILDMVRAINQKYFLYFTVGVVT